MSDSNRPRRTTSTRAAERVETKDSKTARDEITRMLHSDTRDSRPKTRAPKQPWDMFDDLPEQQRRGPLPPRPLADIPSRSPVDVPLRARDDQPARRAPRPARDILDERDDRPRHSPLAESRANLHQAEMLRGAGWSSLPELPLYGEAQRKPWLMVIIAVVSIAVIAMYVVPQRTSVGGFRMPASASQEAPAAPVPPAPPGDHSILGTPTLTAGQIDQVLSEYGSPAAGSGVDWVRLGQQYGIDPAYALAFFVVESSAATAPGWAGWKPDGSSTHNIGNIICAGYPTCFGRFRDYASWQEGIEDWYKLIAVEYVEGRGVHTVEQIIPIYAPSFENDVPAYVGNVERMVSEWRAKRGN